MFLSVRELPRLHGLKAHRAFIDREVLNDRVNGKEALDLVTIALLEQKGTYYTI